MRKIVKSLSDRSSVRSKSSDPTTGAMFDAIVDHAEQNGWETIFTKAGTAAVQFHKPHAKGSYRHSIIVNLDSLNFYLRPPALLIDPNASAWAQDNFAEVKIDANAQNETTIKLRSVADAQRAAKKFLN